MQETAVPPDATTRLERVYREHERNFAAYHPSTDTIWIANYEDTVTRVDLVQPEPALAHARTGYR